MAPSAVDPTSRTPPATCPRCGADIGVETDVCPQCGEGLDAPQAPGEPVPGQVLDGKFRILAQRAEGATARVFDAVQTSLDKPVALKVMHRVLTSSQQFVERFQREAFAASRLSHPNVIRVLDFGRDPAGLFYLAMERIEGRTLAELLAAEGPLRTGRAVRIAVQVLGALEEAHAKGIVHGDLKPDNILVVDLRDARDVVKVGDFGLARVLAFESEAGSRTTRQGVILGTPGYMAPEQALDRPFDSRADLYAVGIVLYEMLTGGIPFDGAPGLVLTRQINEVPQPPRQARPDLAISPAVEAVVLKALSKDPAARFASAAEMRKALDAAVEQEPSRIGVAVSLGASARSPWGGSLRTASVEGDTAVGPTARPLRRRRRILGALLLAGLIGGAGWLALGEGYRSVLPTAWVQTLDNLLGRASNGATARPRSPPPREKGVAPRRR